MDSEWTARKLPELSDLKCCCQWHKVQMQANHQQRAPGVDAGANTI